MANLITRRAARHWGNLMVPIKRLAAAQSNYGETGGPVTGTGWGLSSFLGQGRDLWEGCPHLSISPLPCLPLRGAPSCSQQSLASRCEAGALPQVHPGAFFPYECPFAGAWSICSSEKKKPLPEAKRFAGACGTGLSVGALSGQQHPHGPVPGSVTQKA